AGGARRRARPRAPGESGGARAGHAARAGGPARLAAPPPGRAGRDGRPRSARAGRAARAGGGRLRPAPGPGRGARARPGGASAGDAGRAGYDRELDELKDARDGGKHYIAGLQARERERTGIASLKVGFNKVFGYYIEVTNPHRDRVPPDYERRQTLTGAERYV